MPKNLFGYHDWPLKHKLSFIVIFVSGLLISLMAIAITIDKNYTYRSKLVKHTIVMAEIVGANSTAALTFRDSETAYEILAALKAEKELITACLYDAEGMLFTSFFNELFYQFTPAPAMPPKLIPEASLSEQNFSKRYFELIQPIRLDNKIIGYIGLRTDLISLNAQLQLFVVMVILFSLILFGLGAIICARLNRTIVGPVTILASAMEQIPVHQNFDTRVTKQYNDEIGVLIDGFNTMLDQIQKRDRAIAQYHNHLEELVESRTQELNITNNQLRAEIEERQEVQARLAHAQKMEAIGTLAGGVAHDLNNILSGVVSYPDLLLLDLPENSELRKPIETIKASGRKAAAIVQDLLTLARRGVRIEEQVELKQLILDYLESPEYHEMIRNHQGVEVIFSDDGNSHILTGSPVHLSKTIMNLLSNSAEAIPENGTIEIHLEEFYFNSKPVDFAKWNEGPYICLSITDTGIGIPQQCISRIFEPFYSRKVMGRSGTGLGMAVVWGTVEDHNGYISVTSKEGQGTTFQLFFPANQKTPPTIAPIKLAEKQFSGNGQTVLVVDDSEDQRQIATEILLRFGYSATAVASGEAAVEYIRHNAVDLLLLDMLMAPGIDGLETYRQILQFQPGQKAVIASGYSQTNHIEDARLLGISEYVLKPYTVTRIGEAVHKALQGSPLLKN
jgi:signal transduction histidine kinase/ActR/RegA family two-component response regulator